MRIHIYLNITYIYIYMNKRIIRCSWIFKNKIMNMSVICERIYSFQSNKYTATMNDNLDGQNEP